MCEGASHPGLHGARVSRRSRTIVRRRHVAWRCVASPWPRRWSNGVCRRRRTLSSVERPRRRPRNRLARRGMWGAASVFLVGGAGLDGGGHGILASLGFGVWMRGCDAWNDIHVQSPSSLPEFGVVKSCYSRVPPAESSKQTLVSFGSSYLDVKPSSSQLFKIQIPSRRTYTIGTTWRSLRCTVILCGNTHFLAISS